MSLRLCAAALLAVPVYADVGADRDLPTLLLTHVEHQGRLKTRIYALETSTKRVVWSFDTDDTFEVRPVRAGKYLVVPSGRNGRLHGIDPFTGRERWTIAVEPFRCMLPVDERTFVIGCRNTRVSCYAREGTIAVKKWDRDLPVQAREIWAVGERLYIPTYRNVLCLSARTGSVVWDFVPPEGECLYARPLGKDLIVWDWWRNELYCLALESGKVLWQRAGHASPCFLAASGPRLLITYAGGKILQAIGARSGQEEWIVSGLGLQRELPPVEDLAYHPFVRPVAHGDFVFVVTEDHRVARCSMDRGAILDRWDLGNSIVGLAPARRGLLVALPDRWILCRPTGEKIAEIKAPASVRFLRAID